jgi:hypothetical protein
MNKKKISFYIEEDNENKKVQQPVGQIMPQTVAQIEGLKVTYFLSKNIICALDNYWFKLKNKLRSEGRVTKSLMVEKALEIIFNDLKNKGEESEFYKKLKENI